MPEDYPMKKNSLLALVMFWLVTSSNAAHAQTWSAKCNDLHFSFNRATRKAIIYFKTTNGIFEISEGRINFDNGVALRAPMSGVPDGVLGPMSEVGLNKSRNIVYVLYRNPDTGHKKDGVFCQTTISVEP
jgi:hypothetical protein